ncbi:MAG TPA: GvpL/GvpF family gas vesicle protein [Myxococcota bacterium]|nr:GvpL/GvpF family gas vesicle protein [Myxococcota bacterium]
METEVGGERVLYLYGVVPCGQRLPTTEATPLEAVPFSSLVAVVEPVSATEFSSEALEQKLQCVDWVAPLARKHTAVLEDAMQHGPVVPARLCTLFSSAHALTSLLAQKEQRFQETLSWLKGRQEWGFKVFGNEVGLRSLLGSSDPDVQAIEAAAATGSAGQAYVLRKKRDRRLDEVVSTRIDEVVDEVLDALDSLAVESRLRPLLSEAATGRSEVMVLNAALLVDLAVCPGLRTETAELASRFGAEGFAFELTGPWPPYSFCDDDDATSDLGADESAPEEVR